MLVFCRECGDRLCGKSATGRSGKVGYYEHGWRYRKNFCQTEKMEQCASPNRFSAKRVHEVVLEKIWELVKKEEMAKRLLEKALNHDHLDPIRKEVERLERKRESLEKKITLLTDRLSELPGNVPAAPIFEKMSQCHEEKEAIEKDIRAQKNKLASPLEFPVTLDVWNEFLEKFGETFCRELSPELQEKLIKKIVSRIELGEQEIKIWYYVGAEHVQKQMASLAIPDAFFSRDIGSNNLTNGGGGDSLATVGFHIHGCVSVLQNTTRHRVHQVLWLSINSKTGSHGTTTEYPLLLTVLLSR